MDLHILRDQPLIKFNRQLPIFNWPYPFDRQEDLLTDHLQPYTSLQRAAASRRAIYIHIPFCDTICNFCPFSREKFKSDEIVDHYLKALITEMDVKRHFLGRCSVDAIFIGGGTPSILSPQQIESLGEALHRNFDLRLLREFTVEVEVKSVSLAKLEAMRDIGVSRISFGAQTFSDRYRDLLSLDATRERITEVACLLKSIFPYTNIDILYGLAGQTLDQVHADIEAAVSLETTTIDVYPINNLSAPRTMHTQMTRANLEPLPEATRVDLRRYIERTLQGRGYVPISGYSFAKKIGDCDSVVQDTPKFLYHDLVYGYHDDEIIGYGASAFSQIPGFNIYNFANKQEYIGELLGNNALPHLSFGPLHAPERGIVSFPFRGTLSKSSIPWGDVPGETLRALREAEDAELVVDRGDTYEVTKVGWLFYVNLMYYLMPPASKSWLSEQIEQQTQAGKTSGDTDLISLTVRT